MSIFLWPFISPSSYVLTLVIFRKKTTFTPNAYILEGRLQMVIRSWRDYHHNQCPVKLILENSRVCGVHTFELITFIFITQSAIASLLQIINSLSTQRRVFKMGLFMSQEISPANVTNVTQLYNNFANIWPNCMFSVLFI